MKWGQIKTLFILCFLLLDVYLLILVIQKQGDEDLGRLDNQVQEQEQEQAQEQRLELENITIPEELPDAPPNEAFLKISQRTFTKEEIEEIQSLDNQVTEVVNSNLIISQFEERIAIPENATSEAIAQLVSSNVYLGNEYRLEYWDTDRNILIFFQVRNGRPVYYNQSGMILVYLNESNEMVAYTQTALGQPEFINEEKALIKPFRAIYTLYENNVLFSNSEILDVEIGYYTQFPLDNGVQVLVPTWKVIINERRDRFVHASESRVIPIDEKFIQNVLTIIMENTRAIEGQGEFKESMLQLLNSKLEDNRSEAS